jgi:hypothetical protein
VQALEEGYYLRLSSSATGLFSRGNRVCCPQVQLYSSVTPAHPSLFSVSFGGAAPADVTAGESPAAPQALQSGLLLFTYVYVVLYDMVYYMMM